MTQMTVSFDPNDRADIEDAVAVVTRYLEALPETADLEAILANIAASTYGAGRLGLLKLAAEAGDEGISIQETLDALFDGDHRAYGGTRSSIEKSWRGLGGQTIAPALIANTDDGKRQVMTPAARPIVLSLINIA